jgi:2-oxoglutarate dehydrogenase E2 component (dihydrolipoamide succinyltransferase)
MAKFEIIMPKMGESVIEATITKWLKNPGDSIEEDDALAEIATDKVDSEIPSPVEGKLIEIFFQEGDVVAVGKPIAVIEIEGDDDEDDATESSAPQDDKPDTSAPAPAARSESQPEVVEGDYSSASRFYSPLVKSIAKKENISLKELETIPGSGKDNRVTKDDILSYLKDKQEGKTAKAATPQATQPAVEAPRSSQPATKAPAPEAPAVVAGKGDEIIEMDRMRRLIADHMVMSKQVSPHVTSFIEVDVTNIVNWRNNVKAAFQKKEGQKITFTPIFIQAAAQALREFPNVNASVDGYKVIQRKRINIGMATALPNGNLIVPVIKDADDLSIVGMAKRVNDLAGRARANKLDPDEIQGGTFTVTNFGSFDSLTGTPIINQPQVAILGLGAIKKRPVVLETPEGDVIAIRQIMMLSLAYDHRIVDGALGGMYLKKLRDILEGFDVNTPV